MSHSCHEVVTDPGTVPGLPDRQAFAQRGGRLCGPWPFRLLPQREVAVTNEVESLIFFKLFTMDN